MQFNFSLLLTGRYSMVCNKWPINYKNPPQSTVTYNIKLDQINSKQFMVDPNPKEGGGGDACVENCNHLGSL